ncbi:hypothetical protein DF052_02660 [Burkholderia glumae]|uniref:phage tail tip lysozyme n=1 Tax=Burkholderia glumae TaxID=337 RepID=UPI000F5F866E|nr:phage tail tip lysozyme [Burkholderia glumae]RQZ76075.1 hypothetical protein DF052_02660 [Burkholderia glumae]
MATIVDALVVTLGLDAAAFKRGKAEASQATKKLTAEELAAAKQIEERNKRAADSFRAFRTELLAIVGLFAAGIGIKEFAEQTIKGAIATGQLARDLGMVPGQVRAVEQSFDRLGASAADADDAMRGIQEQAAKLKNGEFDDRLQAYLMNASRAGVKGASVRDVDDPIKKLQQDAEIAQRLAQTQGRGFAILAMQQEGYSRAMADALMNGPAALRAEMDRQSKLNQLAQEEADRLRALDNRWKDFKEGIVLSAQRAVIGMTPAFEAIMKLLTPLSDWFAAHADQIGKQIVALAERFAAWVKDIDWKQVTTNVKSFFAELDGGIKTIGRLGNAFSELGEVINALVQRRWGDVIKHGKQFLADINDVGSDGAGAGGSSSSSTAAGGSSAYGNGADLAKDMRSAAAVSRLMEMGWSKEQAVGLVANFWRESQLNPTAIGDNGRAYGIGQWHPDRQDAFKKLFGTDIRSSTLDQQLQFANYELRSGGERDAGRRLLASTNALDAAAIASRYYERPKNADSEAQQRALYASDLYGALGRANAAQIARQTAVATMPGLSSSVSNTTNSNETSFSGPIHIHSSATDGAGLARDFIDEVGRRQFQFDVSQANTGMS